MTDIAPPAAGDWISIQSTPVDPAAVVHFVTDPRAGGIDLFLGTTRAETNPEGHPLLALDYEAYVEMAAAGLARLASNARTRFPIVKLAILHRLGRVPVGEPSVAIAVACGHRAEAFAACRWLIDALKQDVPIWKKEIWAAGAGTWVHP